MISRLLVLSVFLLRFLSCNSLEVSTASTFPAVEVVKKEAPRRGSVRRNAIRSPHWQFVYAGRDSTERHRLRLILDDIARTKPMNKSIQVVDYHTTSVDSLGQYPVLFLGTVLPEELFAVTPGLERPATYRGQEISEAGDFLRISYGINPWTTPDTTIGIHLLYGPEVLSLREEIYDRYAGDWESMFWGGWDYEVDLGRHPYLKGYFSSQAWEPDPQTEITFSRTDEPIYQDANWTIMAPDGVPRDRPIEEVRERLDVAKKRISAELGVAVPSGIPVHVYPSFERIGLRRGDMETVQYEPEDKSIHLVLDARATSPIGPLLEYALLRLARGDNWSKEQDFIDRGLSLYSNAEYAPRYRNFATALAKDTLLFDRDRLVDRDKRIRSSALLYDASALAVIDYSLRSGNITRADLASPNVYRKVMDLPSDWQSAIAEREFTPPEPPNDIGSFRRGMTFAHEGYRTYNGYGGSTVRPSLDSLASLGVNTTAIVPYTGLPSANELGDLPVSSGPGGENDFAVMHSIRENHAKGWTVMIKPQIWVRGAWPGDIDFATAEEWGDFFHRYTEWIAHYAMLSELEGVDALCIGTEMVRSTVDHPEEWRKIIKLLRQLYGGKLTYAANWGEEFENLSFWEELDVIGLNSYYPLSSDTDPKDEVLLAGARNWVKKAEAIATKYGKDWWLTEVGFRSVRRAWINPHAEAAGRPVSEDCQRRCFAALTTALGEAEHFRGMYIWKWPSYLGRGENRRDGKVGFTPGGKQAAAEVKAFYDSKSP